MRENRLRWKRSEKFLAFLSDESERLGELSARCSFIGRAVKLATRDLLGRTNKTKSGRSPVLAYRNVRTSARVLFRNYERR